jgi:hypothetical protein
MTHSLKVTLTSVGLDQPHASAADAPCTEVVAPPQVTLTPPALSGEKAVNGLAQLVLILVRLLHELLERQAMRRAEAGHLSDEELERVGATLMQQAAELERLVALLDLKPEDLNLDLGPLGRLFN